MLKINFLKIWFSGCSLLFFNKYDLFKWTHVHLFKPI